MKNILIATNAQKVLDFLIQTPGREFIANEIKKVTGLSRAGVNFALRKLVKDKLVIRGKKAQVHLYSVDYNNSIIRQLKVLKTIVLLTPLVNKIKTVSQKIVLFGSCSRGDNIADSDIDLCVLTNSPKIIEEKFKKSNLKVQLIIRNTTQFVKMEQDEPVFFEEIERGITLWESKDESRI